MPLGRIATYSIRGTTRYGAVTVGSIVDLSRVLLRDGVVDEA